MTWCKEKYKSAALFTDSDVKLISERASGKAAGKGLAWQARRLKL